MIHYLTPEQINVNRVERESRSISKSSQVKTNEPDFKQILENKLKTSGLKFSSHAEKRLATRGIELNESDIESLERAVDLAEAKGSRDTLILHEKAAFVVSVKNRTVITAIDEDNLKERVVTNIDSAILAKGVDD